MTAPLSFVPSSSTCRNFFARAKFDPYMYWYLEALHPDQIKVINYTSAVTPRYIGNQIFIVANGGYSIAFLLCLVTSGVDVANDLGHVLLFHTVYQYCRRSVRGAFLWDVKGFA